MTIHNLILHFDNTDKVYFPGQVVSGYLSVQCNKPTKTRGIYIKFKGFGEVNFTDTEQVPRDGKIETETRHYHADELYFESRVSVYGSGTEVFMNPGEQSFPFSFVLPSMLPSSYEGKHGRVRYSAEAMVDIPWGFDKKFMSLFTVNSILDLNTHPSAKMPNQTTNSKNFCCLCCTSGPLSARISIPRTGFVPGESLLFSAEVDNKSNKSMNKSLIRFVETTTFSTPTKQKTETRNLGEYVRGVIPAGETEVWMDVPLIVPSVPPSDLAFCNIINVRYHLEFRVDPSGVGTDLVVTLPIIIGSIPFQNTFGLFVPNPTAQSASNPSYKEASDPAYQPSAPPQFPTAYDNMPPPTYEESMGGGGFNAPSNTDVDPNSENFVFVPKYPVYPMNK